MKKIIAIFPLLLATFSLSAQTELSPKPLIITGRVINYSPADAGVITLNYCDPLSNDDRKAVRLSPSGEFYSKLDMHFSQNMTIKYEDKFINLFVNPCDSVDITIEVSKLKAGDWSGVTFAGDGANINNQFVKFNDYILNIKTRKLNFTLPPKEFIKEVKSHIAVVEDSIRVYAKKNNLDPFIVKWAKCDAVYMLANRLLEYSRDNKKQQLEILTDPIFDMSNQDNFQSMMFQIYLINTLSPLLMQDEGFVEMMKKKDIENGTLAGVKVLMKLPASTSRDYLIYVFVVEGVQSMPALYSKLPKNIFLNRIFDDKLRDMSQKYLSTEIEIVSIGGISYLSGDSVRSVKEQDIFGYLANKYSGKVIYIDIWNTGCGPCIAQFENAKELHKLYARKDVVFVNICLASEVDDWLSVINNKKVEGENYHFDNDNSALFMDMCKIPGYPTYMLMDKTGKLVDKAAPQPQNLSKISELIDNLNKK